MDSTHSTHGYYTITVARPSGRLLLRSNNERAFVISQFQDLLSPRFLVPTVPAHRQLGSCLDLLAYSVRSDAIRLVVFSIDATVARAFAQQIGAHLMQYQDEYRHEYRQTTQHKLEPPAVLLKKLRGPHTALAESIELHLLHEDWEYDRYSSIGFYLHDRRGDWMRTWRLVQLYNNRAEQYQQLIAHRASNERGFSISSPAFAP